jgi:xylulose-5-phosphate/fructose-6-phosphate phosphoketolase
MLIKHGDFCSVYFPADANGMLVTLEDCLSDRNRINIIVAGKNFLPQWRTLDQAKKQQKTGLDIWEFASHENPDIVISSAGDYPTQEALAAVNILRFLLPKVPVRYVNVSELTSMGLGDEKHQMGSQDFVHYFTKDKPIIFNFHGYPDTIKRMFFARSSAKRFFINGYIEEGSTTTAFDLQVRNGTSRFQLVMQACEKLTEWNTITQGEAQSIIKMLQKKLKEHRAYVCEKGVDPDTFTNWKWGEYPAEI